RGVAAGAVTGLAAIHQAGLVHGHLGPDTLVLSPAGPRLVQFSITPPYHYATPAADMKASAQLVLFAAGPRPGPRTPRAGGHHARPGGTRAPTRPPYGQRDAAALPGDLQAAVANCLSPDPAIRPTAREVLTVLLTGHDVSSGLLAEGSRLAQAAARAPA